MITWFTLTELPVTFNVTYNSLKGHILCLYYHDIQQTWKKKVQGLEGHGYSLELEGLYVYSLLLQYCTFINLKYITLTNLPLPLHSISNLSSQLLAHVTHPWVFCSVFYLHSIFSLYVNTHYKTKLRFLALTSPFHECALYTVSAWIPE